MDTETNNPEPVPTVSDNTVVWKISTIPLFPFGRVVATQGAIGLLERSNTHAMSFLRRHQHGDFGDLCAEDIRENLNAIMNGFRILSCYNVGSAQIWVITEADRSATTLLLPSEY